MATTLRPTRPTLPLPARRALLKLGHDIRDARRRRRIPAAVAAARASVSRMTLLKVEKGDPGVAMVVAIGDSAPDRWGRALMRRMERRRAEREGGPPRTLHEVDYLLLVDDEARAGALRFAETMGGPFLRQDDAKRIPPLIELP